MMFPWELVLKSQTGPCVQLFNQSFPSDLCLFICWPLRCRLVSIIQQMSRFVSLCVMDIIFAHWCHCGLYRFLLSRAIVNSGFVTGPAISKATITKVAVCVCVGAGVCVSEMMSVLSGYYGVHISQSVMKFNIQAVARVDFYRLLLFINIESESMQPL